MMLNLGGPIIRPKSGDPKSLLVLLHGYGSDGNDLIGLAPLFSDLLDQPVIFAPNAPEVCPLNPAGYQWFPINGDIDFARLTGLAKSSQDIDEMLSDLWAETGLGPQQTLLAGFSQGGMLSLYAGLAQKEALAGIISFSGGLPIDVSAWPDTQSRPPILLAHGDADEVVPVSMTIATAEALKTRGFDANQHISPGCPHAIAPDSVEAARAFISAHMPKPTGMA